MISTDSRYWRAQYFIPFVDVFTTPLMRPSGASDSISEKPNLSITSFILLGVTRNSIVSTVPVVYEYNAPFISLYGSNP